METSFKKNIIFFSFVCISHKEIMDMGGKKFQNAKARGHISYLSLLVLIAKIAFYFISNLLYAEPSFISTLTIYVPVANPVRSNLSDICPEIPLIFCS